jgi:hypothetical protein
MGETARIGPGAMAGSLEWITGCRYVSFARGFAANVTKLLRRAEACRKHA